MILARCRVYLGAWWRSIWAVQSVAAILSAFGTLWLAVEIATYFAADTNVAAKIRDAWPIFLIGGLALAAFVRRPMLRVGCKLKGRDVTIEIVIGDIFALPGAMVVGSNTTFDTRVSKALIAERSVQGMFTKKYYKGDETQLNAEVAAELNGLNAELLEGNRVGKNRRYAIGTCVRVNPRERSGYFLAICHINEHGNALGTFEDLRVALNELWVYLGNRGSRDPLLVPVLGTGYGRLTQTREKVVQETIQSFVAACAGMICAEKLTIVITPKDVAEHGVSLDDLGAYLRHICKYVEFVPADAARVGAPVV